MTEEKALNVRNESREDGGDAQDVPRKEVDRIYGEMKRWKERAKKAELKAGQLSEKEARISELTGKVEELEIGSVLKESAARLRAVDPAEVASFLASRVKLGEDLKPVVTDEDGDQRLSDEGTPVGVDQLVAEYLEAHPHHVKPTGSKGGGTRERSAPTETMGDRIREASSFEELEGLLER